MTPATENQMPNLIAGHLCAYCLLWLCWATMAPVVAEAARVEPVRQHVCPYIQISHGVGSDLKTFTKAKDLCAS